VDHAYRPAQFDSPSRQPNDRLAGHQPNDRLAGHQLELRLDAHPFWMAPLRALTSDLAARADFDLDAVADLTLAVNEACTVLVEAAAPRDTVVCRFAVGPDYITVTATLPSLWPQAQPRYDSSIGWRILTTLADDVQLVDEERAPGIRLTKHRAPPTRACTRM
jgi:serine/threonine-protein kinase RsbW